MSNPILEEQRRAVDRLKKRLHGVVHNQDLEDAKVVFKLAEAMLDRLQGKAKIDPEDLPTIPYKSFPAKTDLKEQQF